MPRLRALMLSLLLVAGSATAAEVRIVIGLPEPPQNETPGNDPTPLPGGAVAAMYDDVARELCRRMAARCAIETAPVAAILAGVEQGRWDIGFGPFLSSPERARRFALSDPIWHSSSRLVAHRGTAESFAARLGAPPDLANLRDARVAAVAGSAQQAYLVGIAAPRRLTLVPARTAAGAVDRLDDEADFALLPVTVAYDLLATDTAKHLEFAGPPESGHGLGGSAHLALRPDNKALLKAVNGAIEESRADGSFARIIRRHLPVWLD